MRKDSRREQNPFDIFARGLNVRPLKPFGSVPRILRLFQHHEARFTPKRKRFSSQRGDSELPFCSRLRLMCRRIAGPETQSHIIAKAQMLGSVQLSVNGGMGLIVKRNSYTMFCIC